VLCQKFTDKEGHVSTCTVMVQHPGLVSLPLRPLPSLCLSEMLRNLHCPLRDHLNKLMMNDTLPIIKNPSCFTLQTLQQAQETGSLYRMHLLTNLYGVTGTCYDKV
jgi:hypothetical protein